MADELRYACEPSCDEEGARGLDCHECGHSMLCVFCCSNDGVPGVSAERQRLEGQLRDREEYGNA